MSDAVLLYATAPDAETAEFIGAALVEARLAACVNILGPVRSIYRWNDRVERAEEVAFLAKTTRGLARAACAAIVERHPYDLPAVAAYDVSAAGSNPAFLDWIGKTVAIYSCS